MGEFGFHLNQKTGITIMRFFDVLLCLGLLMLAAFIVRRDIQDVRELRRQDRRLITSYNFPVSPRSVVGYDRQGQRITMLPLGFKRMALFVIHGAKLQADIDFWNQAAQQNRSAEVEFVGVCDDLMCIDSLKNDPRKAHFTSVLFGDYYAMGTILKADTRGQIIILDRKTDRMSNVEYPGSSAALSRMISILTEKL
jgi:hypothetical protein